MRMATVKQGLHLLATAIGLAVLASCGGGGTNLGNADAMLQTHPVASNPGPFASFSALVAPRLTTPRVPDATSFMNWAEATYPNLFPSNQPNQTVDVWTYRYYAQTDIYLGTNTTGDVLGLVGNGQGAYTSYPLGKIETFSCSVYPQDCVVAPPPATVGYNECVDPAAMTLPTGFNSRLVYNFVGGAGGQQTVETIVEGPATFEGQSAVRMRTTTSGSNTVMGVTIATTSTDLAYAQLQSNGLVWLLGVEASFHMDGYPVGGFTVPPSENNSKIVYSPAMDDRLFTLHVGESTTLRSVGTMTTYNSLVPVDTYSFDDSTVQTFAAREVIQVYGRSFDTCKYTTYATATPTDIATIWYLVGKGIPVKTETPNPLGTQQMLLLSGTYNGAPV